MKFTPIRIRMLAGWPGFGRRGWKIAPDVILDAGEGWKAWTPVLWDGEKDPDWQESDRLELNPGVFKPPKVSSGT